MECPLWQDEGDYQDYEYNEYEGQVDAPLRQEQITSREEQRRELQRREEQRREEQRREQ